MSSRDEFVTWYLKRFGFPSDAGLNFGNESIKFSFEVWQASRAELAIEMPSTKYISEPEAFVLYDDIKRALEDAGIKVKP